MRRVVAAEKILQLFAEEVKEKLALDAAEEIVKNAAVQNLAYQIIVDSDLLEMIGYIVIVGACYALPFITL